MCIDERYVSKTLEKDEFETLISRLEESPMFIWPQKVLTLEEKRQQPEIEAPAQENKDGIASAKIVEEKGFFLCLEFSLTSYT